MASVTLNQELDSLFLKGLRLLHSSEPNAEEQLQLLWKQAVVDKYGSERTPTSVLHKISLPTAVKRENEDVKIMGFFFTLPSFLAYFIHFYTSQVTNDAPVGAKRLKLESSSPPPASTSAQQSAHASSDTKDSSDEDSPLQILKTESVCKKCK